MENFIDKVSLKNKLYRGLWNCIWSLFARWIPGRWFSVWKIFLLRLFGAKIDKTATIYSSARFYSPLNLVIGKNSCIASRVNCYSVDKIIIGNNVTVSQDSTLCSASHDIFDPTHQLVSKPIIIHDKAWIASEAFIGMGVDIGEGAVVGARSAVFSDVEEWTVVGGNPAKYIKTRKLKR